MMRRIFLGPAFAVCVVASNGMVPHALGQGDVAGAKKLSGAEGLLARGQYDMAAEEFAEYLKLYPDGTAGTRARYGLALCAYGSKKLVAAAEQLGKVAEDKGFGSRDEALALLGAVYLEMGQAEKGLAAVEVLLKEYPKSGHAENALVNKAQALYRLGRYEEAVGAAQELVKGNAKSPLKPTAMYVEALAERAMGMDEKALATLRALTREYPNAPFVFDAQLLIGELLAGQGQTDVAIEHLRKLEAGSPASLKPAVMLGLGDALARGQKYAEAERVLGQLIGEYGNSGYAGPAKLQQAVVLVKSGAIEKARVKLSALGKEYPALNPAAVYWWARCDLLEGKFDAARKGLEQLEKAKVGDMAEVEFDLAYCDLMTGRDAEVVKRLREYAKRYPRSSHAAESLYYQALANFRLGEVGKSEALCEQVGKLGATSVAWPAAFLKGECLLARGEFAKAEGVFAGLEKGARTDVERLKVGLRRGECAFFSKEYTKAELLLGAVAKEPLAKSEGELQGVFFYLGDARLQEGNFAGAVEAMKTYLELSKEKGKEKGEEATLKLALGQLGMKEKKEGVATLQGLMAGDVKSGWVQRGWLEYAQVMYGEKNLAEAGRALGVLLAAKPAEQLAAPGAYLMARVEMDEGKFAEAAKRLGDLLREYPENGLAKEAAFARGMSLKQAKDFEGARQQFAAYVKSFPGGKFAGQSRQQEALCLTAMGKSTDAVKTLSELAGEKGTRSASVLYDLAWAYRTGADGKNAIATYEALLKEYPTSANASAARVELPELLFAEKEYGRAVTLLEAVISGGSADARLRGAALYRLGHCYAQMGEAGKAAKAFDTFITENARDGLAASAVSEAGAAYAKLNDLGKAKAYQKKVLEAFPNSDVAPVAMLRLGEAENQGGEYDAAGATFGKWMKAYPGHAMAARAEFGLGWSLENRGKYAEAREWYGKVVAADNGALGARGQFQIGETYFAEKQFETAAKELLKVDILYESPEWAARALYEAGRAFEQLKNVEQARAQFRLLMKKYPEADVTPLAKKRLDVLGA